MPPRHSVAATRARGFLKRSYNDVEIYVEDTANHNMWYLIIRRLLEPHVKFKSVNLLGGREMVLRACSSDQANDGRKKLYIIDADFDYILNKKKPRLKYLYRLRAYCIENLLLSTEGFVNIAMDSNPVMVESHIRKTYKFNDMIELIYKRLAPLFVLYAVAQELNCSAVTVSYSVVRLCKPGAEELCAARIRARMRQVAREIEATVGRSAFLFELRIVRRRSKTIKPQKWISGKDYVLPPVHAFLINQLTYRGNKEQMKVQLARHWLRKNEPWFASTLDQFSRR
ncbi:MAG: DUF4435 domain-containing protein [Geminicoccaceae bacterium]